MKRSKLLALILTLALCCTFCVSVTSPAAERTANAATKKTVLSGKININTASVEQLELLPRIGNKTAQSIVEYRTQHGPFKTVENLANIKGIGDKTLKELEGFIALEGDTTLKKE